MGRIVDFPQFIAAYPFKPDAVDRSWSFTLTDPPCCPGTRGSFRLTISQAGRGRAVPIPGPCPDRVSIQTMTTMLMGYKRPDYLAKIGRLPTSEATIDMLEDAIESSRPPTSPTTSKSSRPAWDPGVRGRRGLPHQVPKPGSDRRKA